MTFLKTRTKIFLKMFIMLLNFNYNSNAILFLHLKVCSNYLSEVIKQGGGFILKSQIPHPHVCFSVYSLSLLTCWQWSFTFIFHGPYLCKPPLSWKLI